jgi:hypothetical protein
MPDKGKHGIDRRRLFKLSGAAAATVGLLGRTTQKAEAHYLRPEGADYQYEEYEAIVNRRDANVRMLFQFPNIQNGIIWGNARNAINGFEFSYDIPANAIQVVVQAYASANAATYDDYIWEKFQLGERLNVTDPETDEPALRNIWYSSSIDADEVEEPPEDPEDPYYLDTSIEGLQRRGLLVLC